jgi:DNA processing protein
MPHQDDKINYINLSDPNYPFLLKQIPDPPARLYYRGDIKAFNWLKQRFLAIVGSRKPSDYGLRITRNWAYELARQKVILVSGLALGIDTMVHRMALKAKVPTIAVLGCPINQIYPKQNYDLYWQIVRQNGLVISEFAPKEIVSRKKFVTRNRIISGLAKTLLLIEGTFKSGTLVSARYAGQQGREVLVLPGRVDDLTAQAPLLLLKQGANPALSVEEILAEL